MSDDTSSMSDHEIWISYCGHCDAVTFELNDKEGSDRCSCSGEFLPVYKKLLTGRPYKQTQIAPERKWEYPPSYGGPNRKRMIRLRALAALKKVHNVIDVVVDWRYTQGQFFAPGTWALRHAEAKERIARAGGDVCEAHRVWLVEMDVELARPLEVQRSHIRRIHQICEKLGIDLS